MLSQFLFENSEIIFDNHKNLVWTELVVKMFVHFVLLEIISDEPKSLGDD
jgi:hypothetical protein